MWPSGAAIPRGRGLLAAGRSARRRTSRGPERSGSGPGRGVPYGPADGAVRHAIVASQFPLSKQPRPRGQLSGCGPGRDVVGDDHVGKILAPVGGRLKITHDHHVISSRHMYPEHRKHKASHSDMSGVSVSGRQPSRSLAARGRRTVWPCPQGHTVSGSRSACHPAWLPVLLDRQASPACRKILAAAASGVVSAGMICSNSPGSRSCSCHHCSSSALRVMEACGFVVCAREGLFERHV